MAKVIYRTETFGEGDWHVALCPELGISRTGSTPSDAKGCVRDAVESYLRECEWQGILDGVLEDAGFEKTDDVWRLAPRATEELVAVTDSRGDETGEDRRPQNKNYTIKLKSGHQLNVRHLSEADVREKLSEFEAKYGMTSYEFIVKWNRGQLSEEKQDYFKWVGLCHLAGTVGLDSPETAKA
jgi:predicted RNase H-like HicB family nuclease